VWIILSRYGLQLQDGHYPALPFGPQLRWFVKLPTPTWDPTALGRWWQPYARVAPERWLLDEDGFFVEEEEIPYY
jgi:hypothetical protein